MLNGPLTARLARAPEDRDWDQSHQPLVRPAPAPHAAVSATAPPSHGGRPTRPRRGFGRISTWAALPPPPGPLVAVTLQAVREGAPPDGLVERVVAEGPP